MYAKRAVSSALALLLAVSFATPSGARAYSADGFTYDVSDGGDATVTGCVDDLCPADLTIPAKLGGFPVTSIGNSAFNANSLIRVTIPRSVTSIGSAAFYNNALIRVTIPRSVTSIGHDAFANNDLSRVTIPSSLRRIESNVFAYNRLTRVTIPRSVTSIGAGAFASNLLARVTIPRSVTSINQSVFSDNLLTSIAIPKSVTLIGRWAFAYNFLTRVIFLGDAPTDGSSVFDTNSDLLEVLVGCRTSGWTDHWSGVLVACR